MSRAAAALTAIGAFLLAAGEVFFMVMPFSAYYYYAAFSPVLVAVQSTPGLAWLGELFTRHVTAPPNLVLDLLRRHSMLLFKAGLALFVLHAAYLYWCKFVRKGVADRMLYAYVRHPQYLLLMVAGLGVTLRWPRFLDLVLWLAMVGAYCLLARHEERAMEDRHGEAYLAYKRSKGMFVPAQSSVGPAAFGVFAAVVLAAAFGLHAWGVRTLPVREVRGRAMIVSSEALAGDRLAALAGKAADDQALEEGTCLVLYFLTDADEMGHLLQDSGIDRAFPRHDKTPDADLFVLAALAHSAPAKALRPWVVRKPAGIYYLPRGAKELRLERYRPRENGVFSHASVPLL